MEGISQSWRNPLPTRLISFLNEVWCKPAIGLFNSFQCTLLNSRPKISLWKLSIEYLRIFPRATEVTGLSGW